MRERTTIQRGSTGVDVTCAQRALTRAGFRPDEAEGTFGEKTEAAIREFQRAASLTVDGIVGEATWQKLPARASVTAFDVPTERSGCMTDVPMGGRVRGGESFEMHVDFDDETEDRECSCGEYRQFVRGTFKIGGAEVKHLLPVAGGGTPVVMLPRPTTGATDDNFREDGAIDDQGQRFYGHRDSELGNEDGADRYLMHREDGCQYRGSDFPCCVGSAGDTYALDLDFRGQAIDVRNHGTVLATREWTVTCAGTL